MALVLILAGQDFINNILKLCESKSKESFQHYKSMKKSNRTDETKSVSQEMYDISLVYVTMEKTIKHLFPKMPNWIALIQEGYLSFIDQYGKLCYKITFVLTEKRRLKHELA